ncbi:MAG: protein convertase [Legionella sp. 40-6]|nr:ProQ/FinO family protein [Legionella sp.]OJY02477.1 MAG: protein convertase [Legionella sp. 40-6]
MDKQLNLVKRDKLLIIEWLIEHFPSAFFKKSTQVRPLKIGIFDDIIDFYERLDSPPFSKKSLREALSYYSASPAYLNCQKEHAARVDIYGNEVDLVTAEQARYAHQRFQERYNKKKENHPKNQETKQAN